MDAWHLKVVISSSPESLLLLLADAGEHGFDWCLHRINTQLLRLGCDHTALCWRHGDEDVELSAAHAAAAAGEASSGRWSAEWDGARRVLLVSAPPPVSAPQQQQPQQKQQQQQQGRKRAQKQQPTESTEEEEEGAPSAASATAGRVAGQVHACVRSAVRWFWPLVRLAIGAGPGAPGDPVGPLVPASALDDDPGHLGAISRKMTYRVAKVAADEVVKSSGVKGLEPWDEAKVDAAVKRCAVLGRSGMASVCEHWPCLHLLGPPLAGSGAQACARSALQMVPGRWLPACTAGTGGHGTGCHWHDLMQGNVQARLRVHAWRAGCATPTYCCMLPRLHAPTAWSHG